MHKYLCGDVYVRGANLIFIFASTYVIHEMKNCAYKCTLGAVPVSLFSSFLPFLSPFLRNTYFPLSIYSFQIKYSDIVSDALLILLHYMSDIIIFSGT